MIYKYDSPITLDLYYYKSKVMGIKIIHGLPGAHLVVMGTSANPLRSTAGERRTNATTGFSRNSNSPTRMFEASAPGGIFFIKWRSICRFPKRCSYVPENFLFSNFSPTGIVLPHSIGFKSPEMV